MSLEELRQRLDDRFARAAQPRPAAPARHQTLTAVIAWSWDLLDRRGAARAGLALGVPRRRSASGAAEAVLGAGRDGPGRGPGRPVAALGRRGRRERPLPDARDDPRVRRAAARRGRASAEALAAQAAWAVDLCRPLGGTLCSATDQIAAVDELSREENNLADVLRRAMADGRRRRRRTPARDPGHPLGHHRQQPARLRDRRRAPSGCSRRGSRRPSWCRRAGGRSRSWSATLGSSRTATSSRWCAAMERLGPAGAAWARAILRDVRRGDERDGDRLDAVARGGRQRRPSDRADGAAVGGHPGRERRRHRAAPRPTPTCPGRSPTAHHPVATRHAAHPDGAAGDAGGRPRAGGRARRGRVAAADAAARPRRRGAGARRDGHGRADRSATSTSASAMLDEVAGDAAGPVLRGIPLESATRAELALARGDVEEGLAPTSRPSTRWPASSFPGMEPPGWSRGRWSRGRRP